MTEPDDWRPWQTMPVAAAASLLKTHAARIDLGLVRKHPWGPKKPVQPRTRFKGEPHISTRKLLDGMVKKDGKTRSSKTR